MNESEFVFDDVGYWSEVKLDIIHEYASAYSKILSVQQSPSLRHVYVDAFAGGGLHLSRAHGDVVKGSPVLALEVEPAFTEYHFIDLDRQKASQLRKLIGTRPDVRVYEGDCNEVLLAEVLPRCRFGDYRRALWLLDPYGLDLDWAVVEAAGRERSVEIFLNFPVMDMNRNVLWRDPSGVSDADRGRMDRFWGDASWREAAYRSRPNLFGETTEEKATNTMVSQSFCDRLRRAAGFGYGADPLPMRNSKGAVVYYLIFASPKPVAKKIVTEIFAKYRHRGLAG